MLQNAERDLVQAVFGEVAPQAIHTSDFADYAARVEQAAAVAGKAVGATA